MKNQKITTAAICLAAVFTTQVQAVIWDGSDSSDWTDGNNWDTGVPGGADNATIRDVAPDIPNNAVLSSSTSIDSLTLGNGGETASGNLTVNNNATLAVTNSVQMTGSSVLTTTTGTTINAGNFSTNHTTSATLGGDLNSNLSAFGSSTVTVNGTMTGNVSSFHTASVTINGTLNGNFDNVNSTVMQYIGAAGTVNGEVKIGTDDQMTVAGDVNGLFSVNGTGQAFIEATANILSDGVDSWIYNTAAVQWNVGSDGSIGTLRTNRNETSLDAYDGEWRYDATAVDMVVVLDDYVIDGETITLQLVSDIQNESAFAANVTFMLNGDNVTSDFTWDGAGTGSFSGTVVPEPGTYALLAGCFALASVMIRRSR
jgi:hypothetical protein